MQPQYTSLKFFLDGFKPAIIFKNNEKEFVNSLREKGFPFIKLDRGFMIFFQTRDMMIEFENKMREGRKKGRAFDMNMAIGEALGLPPSAAELFAKGEGQNWLVINFYGLVFNTREELVEENLRWLKKRYKVPKDYPGTIEVIDKRETVYTLSLKDINNFKIIPGTNLFGNKMAPIFQVTIMPNLVMTTVYNGVDSEKALKAFNRHKKEKPQLDVWVADKLHSSFNLNSIKEFKDKFNNN